MAASVAASVAAHVALVTCKTNIDELRIVVYIVTDETTYYRCRRVATTDLPWSSP
jgi:hypothetical protein